MRHDLTSSARSRLEPHKQTAGWRLLGARIGVDDQLLQWKAKIRYFNQIKRSTWSIEQPAGPRRRLPCSGSPGTGCGRDSTVRGFARQQIASRRRARPVSGPGNRSRQSGRSRVEPALHGRERFRLPLPILDHCNCCHKETRIHSIFSNAGSKPRSGNKGRGFPCRVMRTIGLRFLRRS